MATDNDRYVYVPVKCTVGLEEYISNVRIIEPNLEYKYNDCHVMSDESEEDVYGEEESSEDDEDGNGDHERKPIRNPVDKVAIKNKLYKADDDDEYLFDGTYLVHSFDNSLNKPWEYDELYHCKAVFTNGNVIYREGCEGVVKKCIYYIQVRSPHPPKDPKKTQMRGGTICPTKEIIHDDGDVIITLYGRYIYGYDKPYVRFTDKESGGTFDLLERKNKALPGVRYEHDFNYAFLAEDAKTKVLLCFGLYR